MTPTIKPLVCHGLLRPWVLLVRSYEQQENKSCPTCKKAPLLTTCFHAGQKAQLPKKHLLRGQHTHIDAEVPGSIQLRQDTLPLLQQGGTVGV